jgi:hypothetical protein
VANIAFNPVIQTNFADAFSVQTVGYVQGTFLDDPAIRFELEQGIVSPSATVPMWGGVPVLFSLPTAGTEADEVGTVLTAASSTTINGWTVFNQAAAMITTPQSNAPQAAPGMSINYFRVGSGARIALQATATAAAAWYGATEYPSTIYWNTSTYMLTNTSGGSNVGPLSGYRVVAIDINANSKIVTYNSSSGFVYWQDQPPPPSGTYGAPAYGTCVVLQI